jgi:hypothetical protein
MSQVCVLLRLALAVALDACHAVEAWAMKVWQRNIDVLELSTEESG